MNDGELKIGVARRDISPDEPRLLKPTGMERTEPTRGVLDPVFVEAMAIETGGQVGLLATSDLRMIPHDWAAEVRHAVAERLGCPWQRVHLSAVHNHCSSPEAADDSPESQAACDRANRKIVEAFIDSCLEAYETRRPAEVAYGRSELREPIGLNRRVRLSNGTCVNCWHAGGVCPPPLKFVGPGGPDSKDIRLLAVREVGAERPFAVLTSYATHPHFTAIPYFSGEFPGQAKREVARRLGGEIAVLQATHCGGDNDLHVVQPEPQGSTEETVQWFQESQQLLAGRFADVVVPAVESLAEWERPATLRHAYWSSGEDDPVGKRLTVVGVMALGDIALVSLPGELFLDLGLRLHKESPFPKLLVTAYNATAGGGGPGKSGQAPSSGYQGPPISFEQGSYEVMRGPASSDDDLLEARPGRFVRRATPASGNKVINKALELLAKLK